VGRKLQQICMGLDENGDECDWFGEPRTPELQPVETTKRVMVHAFSGWDYVIYDKYGHAMTLSCSYESEEDATDALNLDLKKGLKDEVAGPYTAVLFHTPSSVLIEGQVFKKH
jgi:hypothetical protein